MKRPPLLKKFKIPDNAKQVFKGLHFSTYQWEQKLYDDSFKTFEGIKRKDTAIVIPVIGEEVVLVKEIQPHWPEAMTTLIAGGVEDEETLEEGAKREVREETGLVFEDFYLVRADNMANGIDWKIYTFVAKNLKETKEKMLDAGEQNEILKVSFEEMIRMAKEMKLGHRPRLIEEHILGDKIETLYELLRHPEKYQIRY